MTTTTKSEILPSHQWGATPDPFATMPTTTPAAPHTDDRAEGTRAVRGILVGMALASPFWLLVGATVGRAVGAW